MNQISPHTSEAAKSGTKRVLRALVIDDDELVRDTIKNILAINDIHVVTAKDGIDGLKKFVKDQFDVVITDILMPGKEGLETISSLKKGHPKLKVIAISGGGSTRNMTFLELARSLGADKVMSKPFGPKDLLSNLVALL